MLTKLNSVDKADMQACLKANYDVIIHELETLIMVFRHQEEIGGVEESMLNDNEFFRYQVQIPYIPQHLQ